jgi:hypothetical protein
MKHILKKALAGLGLLAVLLFGITGCKGPEKAARQPVSGVDTPAEHKK